METLPVPHPDSPEILRQQEIVKAHVDLGELIVHAATSVGEVPAVSEESSHEGHEYTAIDYRYVDAPVFRNGFGTPMREVEAYQGRDVQTIQRPGGGKITAETRDHIVGGSYPEDVKRIIKRYNPDGSLKDTISLDLGSMGTHREPVPMIRERGGFRRRLSKEEERDVKADLANAFGLKYEVSASSLLQREDARFDVDPTVRTRVENLVTDLMAKGLKGDELRIALLRQVHPDAQSATPESKEVFQYASSLDYAHLPNVLPGAELANNTITHQDRVAA